MDGKQRRWPAWALGLMLCPLVLCGCQSTRLKQVRDAYATSDYAAAYERGASMAQSGASPAALEAAFLAGMAAYQMQDKQNALRYLRMAKQSTNQSMVGKALAQSGIIHYERGQYDLAARQLLYATGRLQGEDKAQAYLMAAKAQQKLGRWSPARESLMQARGYSSDPSVRSHADQRLRLNGYTIQVGAYAVESNARRTAKDLSGRANRLGLGRPRLVPAVEASGRKLVLVQVGQFNDHAAANSARRMLGSRGDVVPVVAP